MVLCTFQGERWLPPFLASLERQERLPDELVVRDDASTDGTVALLRAFAATAPFPVRITVNPERVGSTGNFAAGLGDSRARVVALADQDDVWYPSKLRRMLDELEQDPTISMVFSDADLIGEDGARLGGRLWDTRLVGRTLRRHAVVPEDLFARRALTTGCTMAIRRRAVDAALPFPRVLDDDRALMRHDRWLSLVAAAVGTVRALPEPLLGFRVHPGQQTGVLVGGQLGRALLGAADRVRRGAGPDDQHPVRALQLEAAADRADRLGDFKEAATLRTVAGHHRERADVGLPGHGPLRVLARATRGDYRGDPLRAAAVAADLVRSTQRRHPDAGTPPRKEARP